MPYREHDFARSANIGPVRSRVDVREFPPDHQTHQLALRERCGWHGGGYHRAFPQHRHAVGHGEDLLQPVRDEDQTAPALGKRAQDLEQTFALMRRQRRRGLVENDDPAVQRQRLGDLDHLALTDREVAHLRIERQSRALAQLRDQVTRLRAHSPPAQRAGHAEARQHDVFQHREIGRERRLLRDHRDAATDRLAGAGVAHLPPLQPDGAAIGLKMAGYDARKRRFAGAVGAHQGMDLARCKAESGTRQGRGGAEPLPYVFEREQGQGTSTDARLVPGTTRPIPLTFSRPRLTRAAVRPM